MSDHPPVIDVKNLHKHFGTVHAVNGVSIAIEKGEVFGFLGANGSGKTTTLRMLCGLLTPDAGTGTCLGLNILTQSDQIKARIGYMTQHFSFYEELSVLENLKFVAKMYALKNARQKIDHQLEQFKLHSKKNALTGTLSGGQKQRLALSAALLHEPELLLLDEPTAGVDPKARRDFWDVIHQLSEAGITTLVSTHYMDEAERCTRLAYMSFGEILSHGKIETILKKANLLTFEVRGPKLFVLAQELEKDPNIPQVIAFGASLHVSGPRTSSFKAHLQHWQNKTAFSWREIETRLEDVFIYLMREAHS